MGSLKWLEISLLAGVPSYLQLKESTKHTSLMIIDMLSGIANFRIDH